MNDPGWRKSRHSNLNGACVEVGIGFRTSSHSFSNGNCVEVASGFRTSSYGGSNGDCVEVASGVLVRDTKRGEDSPVLRFTPAAWQEFIGRLK